MSDQNLTMYVKKLKRELRLRDTPGERIGELLAQVESHVADTKEDPFVSFGPPDEYAQNVTSSKTSKNTSWLLAVASWVICIVGGILILVGIFGLIQSNPILWGISAWNGIIFGTLALLLWIAVLVANSSKIKDPRPAGDRAQR